MKKVFALRTDVLRNRDVTGFDILKKLISVTVLQGERRLPGQHLIHDAAHTPPINSSSVALSLANFWSQVFRSSTQGLSILVRLDILL